MIIYNFRSFINKDNELLHVVTTYSNDFP